MAKDVFKFKHFSVWQDQCAMKVCTDACLFGAIISPSPEVQNILDIGTGTGLLSLMLAQKFKGSIEGVEINEDAFRQCESNFNNSPWSDQLSVHHLSIQNFAVSTTKKYDLIISNPPFYNNSLRSNNIARNTAMHTSELSFEDLLKAVVTLLSNKGEFIVMLPVYESQIIEELANKNGLFLFKELEVLNRPDAKIFRKILWLKRQKCPIQKSRIFIKGTDDHYSEEFASLLHEYYLIF